jgi:opacity protein-like surface antigen
LNGSYTLSDRSISARGSGSGDAVIRDEPEDTTEYEGDGSGQVESDLNPGNSWAVGGRIGYLLSDSTLLFGSGGYTQMKAKLKSRFTGSAGAGDEESPQIYGINADYDISSSSSDWLNGYYLGAGVETLLFENFSLKFEYRFADYGNIETSAEAGEGNLDLCENTCWNASVESEADITDHSLMATVSFRL